MKILGRVVFVWMMVLVMTLGACSRTVEGESKRWTANTARVAELSAQYPGFAPAIEARKVSAQKIHDTADSLQGEPQIQKLTEASTALMGGFVGELDTIDDKMKRLREARVDAAAQAGDSTKLGAKVAVEDAQRALDRAEVVLKSGATDEASAAAVLKKVSSDLDTARSTLDKLVAADKAKRDEAAGQQKASADSKAAGAAAAEAKAAPWKCEYCGSSNTHDHASCESCGAARGGDAKAAKTETR